jgi:hypothetical protein
VKAFRDTSIVKWIRSNKVLFSLVIISGIGLTLAAFFTIAREYVPSSRITVFNNNSHDMDILVTYEKNINIPVESLFVRKISPVQIYLYPFKIPPPNKVTIKNVNLVSNTSNPAASILSIQNPMAVQQNIAYQNWFASVEAGHPLEIKNYTEQFYIEVLYRNKTQTLPTNNKFNDIGPIYSIKLPIKWSVSALDWGKASYFWIVFIGVLVSRVFSYSSDMKSLKLNRFSSSELLWVPFSAIITLLIFSSFKEQVRLTNDIITNMALAFGFGFGFDRVFETWKKVSDRGSSNEETATNKVGRT